MDPASPRSSYRKQIIKSVLENKQKFQSMIGDPRNSKNEKLPLKYQYKMTVQDMIKQGQKNAFDEFGLEGFP